MKYNFDEIVSRRGLYSSKWKLMKRSDGAQVSGGVFPYSVADMEFCAAPKISREHAKFTDFGIFGYHDISQSIFDPFVGWMRVRHNWNTRTEWMRIGTGVVSRP